MLLTNSFRPDPRVYEEAKVLVEAGHEVEILCWDREGSYPSTEVIDKIKVKRFKILANYGVPSDFVRGISRFYLSIIRHFTEERYDVIHAHDFDTLPLAIILRKLHGCKVVYDVHDHYSSMIADVLPTRIARIVRLTEKFFIRYTDANIAATEELGRLIFGATPFITVMNAKDLRDFDIPAERLDEFRKEQNPEGRFLIVYIGILKLWTPLPSIIEAVKGMDDVLLLIGGDGPHREKILRMIKEASNIRYLGWVNKRYVPLYTSIADVVILPSNSNKEYTRVAVANKLMEALAAGKPIIAGKNTAGERIVKECNAGLLCNFGDVECLRKSIRYLIENPDTKKEMGRNARKCAEDKYNWEIMKNRLLGLYSKL